MKKYSPKNTNNILLGKNSPFKDIVRRASNLKNLSLLVDQFIPAEIKPHYQLANFDNGYLIIIADTSAWATKLRYHSTAIMRNINDQKKLKIFGVKVKVKKQESKINNPQKQSENKISQNSKKAIANFASTIEDESLRESLLRLSKIVKK